MLTVYGKETSLNVRKVLWLCDELALDHRCEEPESATFRRVQADNDGPVLRDGDFVLREANTILRYLASSHQAYHLYPQALHQRALTEQWMDWQATELNTSWRFAFSALVRQSPAHQNSVLLEAACKGWNDTMAVLNQRLIETGYYVAGRHFTLADIPIGLAVNRWYETPFEKPACPAIRRYYQRLTDRQGYVRWGRNGIP